MICNKCGAYFHEPATVREPMDDEYNGQRSFMGYQVCPDCRSSNIEETNRCMCGEIKRKSEDYCTGCLEVAKEAVDIAITTIEKFAPRGITRKDARELLKFYVEDNL